MASKDKESQEINIIGQSTSVEGTIKSQGNIRIDGMVSGTVTSEGNFIVGLTGEVEGNVQAKTITISGKFKGDITAQEKLVLENNSKVIGDLLTRRLVVEDGALFNGHCKMDTSAEA
jgi:cytoskeletal protein CcmA (bactofilin family)